MVNDIFYIAFLPVILLFFLAGFISLDKILLTIVFFTPLSIQLNDLISEIPVNLYLPTEPLLLGVLVLFIFKILLDGKFDKRILLHPVSIAIYINIFWIFITAITSTMPIVSFKFLLSRLWFVAGMYFVATQVFKRNRNIERFIWLYIIPLLIVIIYTNVRLAGHGLDNQSASNWVVWPFFNDHTSYGAMLVMFLFPLFYFLTKKSNNLFLKSATSIVFAIFSFAIVLSYTRAAWLSLFAGIGLWILVKLKIKMKVVLFSGLVVILLFFVFQTRILNTLEGNESESSGRLSEHVESITNITSDASNTERINRWKCALRMFKEKPFFGWGPGTYKFQYAPFQVSQDRTIISTNFGTLGNAHSEYLGALSESGVVGMLSFMLVVFMAFRTGYRIYHQSNSKQIKELTLYIMLGLSTYFIHGFLNNFLDTDKASVPVWGFIAMLVAIDVYHKKTTIKTNKD
ncbi:MAG: O-antigen ligase family protein [Bacteroidales bacterium]|jgi:putative inorganic carbon (HCO3(-)) transporter|nr:O-antigen ligase family protein [Bacteroidales bacterium]